MIRNFKTLGLALVAVLAFSAMAASAASATNFTASEYPATIKGEQVVSAEYPEGNKFELNGNVVTCSSVTFAGSLAGASEELELEPAFGGTCVASGPLGKLPITFTLNGCKLKLTILTVHLVCPAGKAIEIHLYSNHTNHTNKSSLCTFTIHPQTFSILTYIFHKNLKRILWTFIKKFKVTRTSGSALVCGSAEQEGTYRGEAELSAKNSGGEEINVHTG